MISTIGVHQPPPMPPPPSSTSATMGHPMRRQHPSASQAAMMTLQPNGAAPFCRRQLGLTCLDLTDCVSVEDSGLKMIVETCPQLQYLFLRRCVNITGDCLMPTHSENAKGPTMIVTMISTPPSFRALSRNSKFGTQRIGAERGSSRRISCRDRMETAKTAPLIKSRNDLSSARERHQTHSQ